tara:strand:+ start:423 stop:614 length:192 start_codon:yes stop_codon:yes gene_type:complete
MIRDDKDKHMSVEELKEIYFNLNDPSLVLVESVLWRIHNPYEAAEYLDKFVQFKVDILMEDYE